MDVVACIQYWRAFFQVVHNRQALIIYSLSAFCVELACLAPFAPLFFVERLRNVIVFEFEILRIGDSYAMPRNVVETESNAYLANGIQCGQEIATDKKEVWQQTLHNWFTQQYAASQCPPSARPVPATVPATVPASVPA